MQQAFVERTVRFESACVVNTERDLVAKNDAACFAFLLPFSLASKGPYHLSPPAYFHMGQCSLFSFFFTFCKNDVPEK